MMRQWAPIPGGYRSTIASGYYDDAGCDGQPSDPEWMYYFAFTVPPGYEYQLYYFNSAWWIDGPMRASYPNGLITYFIYHYPWTWACVGQTAWFLGLEWVRQSLHMTSMIP
jgi:hypothetical protein